MPPSNLSIAPITPDQVHIYQEIRHIAFKDSIVAILYARQPRASQETLDRVNHETREAIENGVIFMGCWDNDTNEMIAGARWKYAGPSDENQGAHAGNPQKDDSKSLNPSIVRPRDRTWAEVDAGLKIPEPYPESDPRLFTAFFELLNSNKREILGTRPYYVLETLITHPNHHRRGAGGMLLKWGIEQADEKGVEIYVEASPMGAPLYEKFGFKEIKRTYVDVAEFVGGGEKHELIHMRRPAKWESQGINQQSL